MRSRAPASKQENNSRSFIQRKPSLRVSEKDDHYEQEADRIADAVVKDAPHGLGRSLGRIPIFPALQRQKGEKPKSEEEKYKEAAKKVGEAFLETGPGKEIKEKAEKLGDAFISTLPGKIITGSAITGVVVTLAATHKELPIGIPEIPLDKIKPGLKLKITYEGPVDKPTKVIASFTIPLGASQEGGKKPAMTKSEQFRAETARMAMEQHQFRESLKTPEQKVEDQRLLDAWLMSRVYVPGRPVAPAAVHYPTEHIPPPLVPYAKDFKVTGEQPKTEEPKKKKEEGTIQRKGDGAVHEGGAPAIVNEVLDSPGKPLDPATRSFMEAGFGRDFCQVRIHTDSRAEASARAVNARAYTAGHDVIFAAGSYSPSTPEGQHLLAHELTHVVQQAQIDPVSGPILQCKGGTAGGFFSNLGRSLVSLFGDEPDYPDTELQQYLTTLDTTNDIEDDFDSDDKARAVVGRWGRGTQAYILPARLKVLLIREMLSGATLAADENAILALLEGSNDTEIGTVLGEVGETKLRSAINGDQGEIFDGIIRAWQRRRETGNARTGSINGLQAQAGDTGIARRLAAYLRFIDVYDRIQRDSDSHRLAREIVRYWSAGDERYFLPPRRKQLLLMELLTGTDTAEDREAVLTLLRGANDVEIRLISSDPGENWIKERMDVPQKNAFEQLFQSWRTRQTTASANRNAAERIVRVVVNQEIPQTVTVHWSGGGSDADFCSTGKGHCCVPENAAQGAVSSESESRQDSSNCTPVGVYPVAFKVPQSGGGVKWWTEFYDSRDIALHAYPRVDGTPLSHGCVRLNEPMAKKIYDGVIDTGPSSRRTQVEIRGLARPRCNWPALQAEWAGDFRTAGSSVDDGEPPDIQQQQRASINRQRATEREIYGISDEELTQQIEQLTQQAGELPYAGSIWGERSRRVSTLNRLGPVGNIIPRCLATQTVEERRLASGNTPSSILQTSTFDRYAAPFQNDLGRARNLASAEQVVIRHGRKLWQEAVSRAQRQQADTDDRPLYWARLQMTRVLRQWTPGWSRTNPGRQKTGTIDDIRRDKTHLLGLFETASRGMDSAVFRAQQADKRILISGFDPFGLHQNIDRGNPSGAAVLALDNRSLTEAGITAQVQGVIFPVRFADFDSGMVERFFGPYINSTAPPNMIMTISQGGSQEFEVERYAGRRRSSGDFPDNLGRTSGGTLERPVEATGLAPGPEFLETTLPARALRSFLGRSAPLPGETEFMEIRQGERRPVSGSSPTAGGQAVRGSGGGYLSNEIFYRTSLLRHRSGKHIPIGHLHTPYLPAPSAVNHFQALRDAIVSRVEQILKATLPHI